jgi:tRNA threonylcarbamoyladenosine biosynthesis protein TsaE
MRQPDAALLNVATAAAMRAVGARLGQAIGRAPRDAFVIGFEGELGAGKTTLVAGVLHALGVDAPVRSPTYTLIEPYEVDGRQLYHLDLYRLKDPAEVEPLAVRDLLIPSTVLLIEWPSRGGDRVPGLDLAITIEYADSGGRVLRWAAGSDAGAGLARAIDATGLD